MRDNIDVERYKKRLEDRLAVITSGQEDRKKETTPVALDQSRVGRLSRMDAMQQHAMSQAAARLEDLERQRIRSALARIRSGDFGYCILCEEEIAEGRLRFDPSMPTCISCARHAESG